MHMSAYVKRSMQDDEVVRYTAQLHWIVYHFGIIITVVGAAIGHFLPGIIESYISEDIAAFLADPIKYASIFMVCLGGFQLIGSFIRQISTELVITDQRVIAKHGFISTTSYELMMTKVEGATIDQTVLGRVLGYGTLMIKGTGGGISPIDHVAKPFFFHAALMDSLQASNEGDGARRYVPQGKRK